MDDSDPAAPADTQSGRQAPHFTDRAMADLEARRAREAAALRANLHRRKAQMRGRAAGIPTDTPAARQDDDR